MKSAAQKTLYLVYYTPLCCFFEVWYDPQAIDYSHFRSCLRKNYTIWEKITRIQFCAEFYSQYFLFKYFYRPNHCFLEKDGKLMEHPQFWGDFSVISSCDAGFLKIEWSKVFFHASIFSQHPRKSHIWGITHLCAVFWSMIRDFLFAVKMRRPSWISRKLPHPQKSTLTFLYTQTI